jgi:thiol-disulfide isomerase/thioredoxin
MHKTIAIIGFLLFTLGISAQNTTISGTAPGAEGLKIRLLTPADYVSEIPRQIDVATIDPSGKFSLKTSLNQTIYAQLQIDFYKGDIYLEAGKSYNISITQMNYAEEEKISPFLSKKKLIITPVINDTTELNQQISSFNQIYDDFLVKDFKQVYYRHDKLKIDSLKLKLDVLFGNSKNSYLMNYIKYRIAGIEQMGRFKNSYKLYDSYIANQSILYNHIEYMLFFNQLYDKFIFNGRHNLSEDDLQQFINTQNYFGLLDAMGRDSLVKNEVVRELVFLKGMKDLYYANNYNKDNIIAILTKFINKTKFKEHKQIANNLIIEFRKLKTGSKAPDFKLKNNKEETFTLSSFAGKYTYIGFFTTWCAACLNENDAIAVLKKKYGDKINFVSISVDKQLLNMNYYLDKHKYDWVFLHYGNNIELLENYNVFSYPFFILLDNNGNIVSYPALKPSENIESEFKTIFDEK